MDITQEIYDRAAKISAIRARAIGDDKWAFHTDDIDAVKQWILDGTLKIAVKSGIIKFDSGEAPEPDVLADEQLLGVVYYILSVYFDTIGEKGEGSYYRLLFDDEMKNYRFDPHQDTTATKKYNMGLG